MVALSFGRDLGSDSIWEMETLGNSDAQCTKEFLEQCTTLWCHFPHSLILVVAAPFNKKSWFFILCFTYLKESLSGLESSFFSLSPTDNLEGGGLGELWENWLAQGHPSWLHVVDWGIKNLNDYDDLHLLDLKDQCNLLISFREFKAAYMLFQANIFLFWALTQTRGVELQQDCCMLCLQTMSSSVLLQFLTNMKKPFVQKIATII